MADDLSHEDSPGLPAPVGFACVSTGHGPLGESNILGVSGGSARLLGVV